MCGSTKGGMSVRQDQQRGGLGLAYATAVGRVKRHEDQTALARKFECIPVWLRQCTTVRNIVVDGHDAACPSAAT